MDDKRLELKIGSLVLASVLGLVGLLWLMGELGFRTGKTLQVDFAHSGNVARGAPVKMGGITVGRVVAVELLPTRRDASGDALLVRMSLGVSSTALDALRADARVSVSSQGPLGEPFLELSPGRGSEPLAAEHPIRGLDAPRIDVVSAQLARFLGSASDALEAHPEAMGNLFMGLGGLSKNLNDVMTDSRQDLRALVQELAGSARDLRVVSTALKDRFGPSGSGAVLLDNLSAASREFPAMSRGASGTLSSLAALTQGLGPQDSKSLKSTLARLDSMSGRADVILKKIESGDGSLGALVQDKQVYDDLKSLLADLRKNPWKMLWKN